MGATNYYNKNASRVFSLEPDFSDDNCVIDSIASEIINELKCGEINEGSEGENYPVDRNYPATFFGEVEFEKCYANDELQCFKIELCYRSGYYTGVNFDYNIIKYKYKIGDYYNDYVDELSPYVEKKLQKEIKRIEQVYSKFTEPLEVVGRFSNGETVYKKVF